jgi:hypothetical protein
MEPVSSSPKAVLVRCGGCGDAPAAGQTLRRGRCQRCYDNWVRSRPVGVGANCVACSNRRHEQLRHFEVGLRLNAAGGRWTILCHNCAATADIMTPPPRSIDALCQRLSRDRRWQDRRYDRAHRDPHAERRSSEHARERRHNMREMFDATELAEELVLELEAEYEVVSERQLVAIEDVTGIHMKTSEEPTHGLPGDDLFLPIVE